MGSESWKDLKSKPAEDGLIVSNKLSPDPLRQRIYIVQCCRHTDPIVRLFVGNSIRPTAVIIRDHRPTVVCLIDNCAFPGGVCKDAVICIWSVQSGACAFIERYNRYDTSRIG